MTRNDTYEHLRTYLQSDLVSRAGEGADSLDTKERTNERKQQYFFEYSLSNRSTAIVCLRRGKCTS